jgi:Flp pilus assembly protein TadB
MTQEQIRISLWCGTAVLCGAVAGNLFNTVLEYFRRRESLVFKDEVGLRGAVSWLVWSPGVPVNIRRKYLHCLFWGSAFAMFVIVPAVISPLPVVVRVVLAGVGLFVLASPWYMKIRHRHQLT